MDLETLKIMDEKLEKCKSNCSSDGDKIDKRVNDKLEKATFFWIMGIAYSVLSGIIGILYGRINTIEKSNNEVYFNVSNRLTAIETNTSNTSKQIEQMQEYFAKFDIKINK